MAFFTETKQKNNQICMELQKNPTSKSNPEKKSQRYHTTWLQIVQQSYDNPNSKVLAVKQTQRPKGQN